MSAQTTCHLIRHSANETSLDVENEPRRILRQLLPDQRGLLQHSEIIPDALLQAFRRGWSAKSQNQRGIKSLLGNGAEGHRVDYIVCRLPGFNRLSNLSFVEQQSSAVCGQGLLVPTWFEYAKGLPRKGWGKGDAPVWWITISSGN